MRLIHVDHLLQTGLAIEPLLKRRLTEIFAEHGRETTELAYFMTGERELAQDISQEAFVRLFGRFGNLRDENAVRSYLRKTVINLARSHFRKQKSERSYLARQAPSESVVGALPDLDAEEDMFRLLQRIPHRQRATLVFRFYFDLSESQTAEILGISEKAVNGLVGRGLDALRKRTREKQ